MTDCVLLVWLAPTAHICTGELTFDVGVNILFLQRDGLCFYIESDFHKCEARR